MQFVHTSLGRGVQIIKSHTCIDDTDPVIFLLSATLSFEQYSYQYLLCAKTCENIEDETTTLRF